jgi:predicted small lipoprotein YifL
MLPYAQECPKLSFLPNPRMMRIATVGALVAALLAGCGRKGGLDPPPGASIADHGVSPAAETGPGDQAPRHPMPIDRRIG